MAGGQRWGGRPPQNPEGGSVCVSSPSLPFHPIFEFLGRRGPQGGQGTLPRSPPALKGRFVRGGAVGEGPAALPPQPCPGGMKDLTPTDNKGGRGALPPHGPARSGGDPRPLPANRPPAPGGSAGAAWKQQRERRGRGERGAWKPPPVYPPLSDSPADQ